MGLQVIERCSSTAADVYGSPVPREAQLSQSGGTYDQLVSTICYRSLPRFNTFHLIHSSKLKQDICIALYNASDKLTHLFGAQVGTC